MGGGLRGVCECDLGLSHEVVQCVIDVRSTSPVVFASSRRRLVRHMMTEGAEARWDRALGQWFRVEGVVRCWLCCCNTC